MPRYHFDVINGDGLERDNEGLEIGKQKVPAHVAAILTDIAKDELPKSPEVVIQVSVRDETEQEVFRGELSFKAEWTA